MMNKNGKYYHFFDGKRTIYFFVYDKSSDGISLAIKNGNLPIFDEVIQLLLFCNNKGTFLDIGANLGLYSFIFGANNYKVFAFEANAENVEQMNAAQKNNGFDITIVSKAVTEKTGLYYFHNNGPWGHLSTAFLPDKPYVPVDGISIDDWYQTLEVPDVSLIKIDIEGSEIEAIKGMLNFLRTAEYPPIFTEYNGWCLSWSLRTADIYFDFFRDLGYQPYFIKDATTAEKVNCTLQPKCVQNFLMVHESNLLILNGKTIIEGKLNADDEFFEEALKALEPAVVYYYAWTIYNLPRLHTHNKMIDFLARLKTFDQPYNREICNNILDKIACIS